MKLRQTSVFEFPSSLSRHAQTKRIDCHFRHRVYKVGCWREARPWRLAADTIMFDGHDPYLVALSVAIAILGGFTGFSLAARIRSAPGVNRRAFLAGAATF